MTEHLSAPGDNRGEESAQSAKAVAPRTSTYVDQNGRFHATILTGRTTTSGDPVRLHVTARTRAALERRIHTCLEPNQAVTADAEVTLVAGTEAIAPAQETMLGVWLETWLNEVVAFRVRTQTRRVYAGHVRNRLAPALGDVPLSELAPVRIEDLLADMHRAGASPFTTHAVLRTLRSAMGVAERRGHVARNAAAQALAPSLPSAGRDRARSRRGVGWADGTDQ